MAPMSKSSKGSQSSNIPIVCPLCHPDLALPVHSDVQTISNKKKAAKRPAVWKYNMEFHFATKHHGSIMAQALVNALKPVDNEESRLAGTKGLKNAAF